MEGNKTIGFTLMEVLIVVVLMTLFLLLTIPFGIEFYREQVIEEQTSSLTNNLKIAQSHALSGKNDSSWGIKFFTDYYILFMGEDYDDPERDTTYDREFSLSSGIEIEGISEVVFEKGTGKILTTSQ